MIVVLFSRQANSKELHICSSNNQNPIFAGAGGIGGAATAVPGGACTKGTGAAGASGVGGAGAGGAGAGDPVEPGGAGAGGTGADGAGAGGAGAGDTGAVGAGAGGTGAGGAGAGGAGAGDTGTVDPGARGDGAGGAVFGGTGAGGTVRPRPYYVPLLQQVLGLPSSTGLTPPLLCPQPDQTQPPLQPASPLPAPSPYTKQTGGPTECREPESRPASPVGAVRTGRRVPRPRPPPVPRTHAMALRLPLFHCVFLYRFLLSPLFVPTLTLSLTVALAASPTVSRLLATVVTDPSFESTAVSALVAELVDFAAACRLDYVTALVAESESASPPYVGGESALGTDVLQDRHEDLESLAAAAITGPYSSQWKAAMDAEMASWKSTGTYVNAVPLSRANIVDGMWILRLKRPPGSPPTFKAPYVARGFSQRQGVDYFQTFSPILKMTTLWVLLHVAPQRDYELHSLDFNTAFFLRRPVYGLRQAPREWHDTLRTTLVALGFTPFTADPLLFLRTDTSLPPFYVILYVLQRFGFQFSSPQPTPLSTNHSLSAPPSDESVEPSGPYPELVGCLMYLMTCTRPDPAYPLSLLARYVALGRHRKVHWDAAKRVLRYLCSTSGMGFVLGGRGPVVLTGHIYVGAMAAQELRWLTYLLTDLGEQPRWPLVLYVDNKAMIALCQEHRLEHRTKHIAQRYFLARDLQQCG
ncbi:unnamed protein product [Closterium sp. NIES-53]